MRKIENRILSELYRHVERFLELDSQDCEDGRDSAEKIIERAEKISDVISEEQTRDEYNDILAGLNKHFSKLSEDLERINGGCLSSDWSDFARKDFANLRDAVMELKEFLRSNEVAIRRNLIESSCGIDPQALSLRLEEGDRVEKVVRTQFSKLIDEMDSEEIAEKVGENRERLQRISKWLLAIKQTEEIEAEL